MNAVMKAGLALVLVIGAAVMVEAGRAGSGMCANDPLAEVSSPSGTRKAVSSETAARRPGSAPR